MTHSGWGWDFGCGRGCWKSAAVREGNGLANTRKHTHHKDCGWCNNIISARVAVCIISVLCG